MIILELETSALKIAHYDFTDKDGKHVATSKLLISLGDFGYFTACSPDANDLKTLSKCKVIIQVNSKNKLVIKSIVK